MKRGSIFELNGIPKFQEALPLALQHVVAMIVGCVTPAIIVAGAVGGNSLSAKDRVILIQASLVVSALSTLIQLFPIGKKNGFTLIELLSVIIILGLTVTLVVVRVEKNIKDTKKIIKNSINKNKN